MQPWQQIVDEAADGIGRRREHATLGWLQIAWAVEKRRPCERSGRVEAGFVTHDVDEAADEQSGGGEEHDC